LNRGLITSTSRAISQHIVPKKSIRRTSIDSFSHTASKILHSINYFHHFVLKHYFCEFLVHVKQIAVFYRLMSVSASLSCHKWAVSMLHRIQSCKLSVFTVCKIDLWKVLYIPVALTHPLVEYPHKIALSHPKLANKLLKLVPKKLLEYCFKMTTSSFLGSTPFVKSLKGFPAS
jgi:hypothetical protein